MATQVEYLTGLVNVAIPEVYQKGMSYYEVLTAVVNKVNELIEKSNEYFSESVQTVMTNILIGWKNDGTLGALIADAVLQIGDQQYTEQNYVSNGESLTESIDAIDKQVAQQSADFNKYSMKVYNAKDYGLNGVGINQAIDDAETDGGGVVVLDGEFVVNDEIIIIKPNVSLIGLKNNRLILIDTYITTNGLPFSFNSVIENINIDAQHTTNTTSIYISGLDNENRCKDIICRNNNINCNQTGNNGISAHFCDYVSIYGNTINETGQGNGITVINSYQIDIHNNKVFKSGRAGIQVFSECELIRIYNNYVYGWGLRRDLTDGGIDSYGPYNKKIYIYNNIVDTGVTANMSAGNQHHLIRLQGVSICYVKVIMVFQHIFVIM